jgi:hypothetical protein
LGETRYSKVDKPRKAERQWPSEQKRRNMPARALKLILEWWELNKDALAETWNRAHSGVPLGTIEPLK